jgi:hypothetical protein
MRGLPRTPSAQRRRPATWRAPRTPATPLPAFVQRATGGRQRCPGRPGRGVRRSATRTAPHNPGRGEHRALLRLGPRSPAAPRPAPGWSGDRRSAPRRGRALRSGRHGGRRRCAWSPGTADGRRVSGWLRRGRPRAGDDRETGFRARARRPRRPPRGPRRGRPVGRRRGSDVVRAPGRPPGRARDRPRRSPSEAHSTSMLLGQDTGDGRGGDRGHSGMWVQLI